MKIASYIGLIAGLAVLTMLIAWQGIAAVGGILLDSGWTLLLVPLIWLPTVLLATRSWQLLFDPAHAPGFWPAFQAQWMGRSVNTLLPVADIGGEVVKARVLALWGTDPLHAGASAVVDKTVQVAALVLWGVVGLLALWFLAPDTAAATGAGIGLGLLAAAAIAFFLAQHAGMFGFMARAVHRLTGSERVARLSALAHDLDRIIRAVYRQRRRTVGATAWRFLSFALQTGEVWLAAYLLGFPIGPIEAAMLKSLTSAASDAAFVVPNAYGVQEGAYVVLGALVGLTPDVALAVSLATRIREVLFDVPGLLLWQHAEGRALVRRRRSREGA